MNSEIEARKNISKGLKMIKIQNEHLEKYAKEHYINLKKN